LLPIPNGEGKEKKEKDSERGSAHVLGTCGGEREKKGEIDTSSSPTLFLHRENPGMIKGEKRRTRSGGGGGNILSVPCGTESRCRGTILGKGEGKMLACSFEGERKGEKKVGKSRRGRLKEVKKKRGGKPSNQ